MAFLLGRSDNLVVKTFVTVLFSSAITRALRLLRKNNCYDESIKKKLKYGRIFFLIFKFDIHIVRWPTTVMAKEITSRPKE